MDKAVYVERAPLYYALAIAVALSAAPGPMTEYKIKGKYIFDDGSGDPEPSSLLGRPLVWERAVQWLATHEMILIKHDTFGPSIYFKTESFAEKFNDLTEDDNLPFKSWHEAGRTDDWLVPALHSVNNAYENLDISQADFEDPERHWKPLPIDRNDPVTVKAIESLQKVIDEVRADNGYNSNLSQERDFVLEGLQGTVDKLNSESISPGYIQQAFERLGVLARRFTGSAKELTITAAKAALLEFGKKYFGQAIEYITRWLFF